MIKLVRYALLAGFLAVSATGLSACDTLKAGEGQGLNDAKGAKTEQLKMKDRMHRRHSRSLRK